MRSSIIHAYYPTAFVPAAPNNNSFIRSYLLIAYIIVVPQKDTRSFIPSFLTFTFDRLSNYSLSTVLASIRFEFSRLVFAYRVL